MRGSVTYGEGEWIADSVIVRIDEHLDEYGLYHTQYLDYKDSLQATSPIAFFDSKEEAENAAKEHGLSIEYAYISDDI